MPVFRAVSTANDGGGIGGATGFGMLGIDCWVSASDSSAGEMISLAALAALA